MSWAAQQPAYHMGRLTKEALSTPTRLRQQRAQQYHLLAKLEIGPYHRAHVVPDPLPFGERDPSAPAGHQFSQSPFVVPHLARGFGMKTSKKENVWHLNEGPEQT
jgi:hypothetical protein